MFVESLKQAADYVLFASCLFLLAGSVFISFRTRFVQLRCFSILFKMFKTSLANQQQVGRYTILPHKALLTAMSTTIGISTIVAPVIAVYLGGPGSLIGFLLASFFGSAATFTEVNLCIQFREKSEKGSIRGGPMPYLKHLLSPFAAKWYAACCFILMAAWSSAQANQLAAILDSPLLGAYRVPTFISGIVVAGLVVVVLIGGIKRISALASKLVPLMFILYLSASFWIILSNLDQLGSVFREIFHSFLYPQTFVTGAVIGGVVSAMRWGIFKGTQTCEAGIGTQTIPHSMAETSDPLAQGALAMVSTFTAGGIAFLSGCVALITKTWMDPSLPLGISMVAASFEIYFSKIGVVIVAISALLFAFGTILGNSYNGSQCFRYFTKKQTLYFAGTAVMIFLGAISEVTTVWSLIDIVLACVALPHMTALVLYAYRNPSIASEEKESEPSPVALSQVEG